MKAWFTAAELADAALPILPTTEFRIRCFAEREGWTSRKRNGHGGRPAYEYPIDVLPKAARIALIQQQLQNSTEAGIAAERKLRLAADLDARADRAAREAGLVRYMHLTDAQKRRADARLIIVKTARQFVQDSPLPVKRARELFAHRYQRGEIEVEAWVRGVAPTLCANSLANWHRRLMHEGIGPLAGDRGVHRKGRTRIDENKDWRDVVLGMMVDHPHASAKLIMRALRARFGAEGLPSYRSLQRWLAAWKHKNKQLHTAITNPDAWRSRYQAAGGKADEGIVRLNQRWETDGTKADLLLADGSRHTITGVIDVYSRRLKLHVSRSSTAAAVASLMRRAIVDWGVPETVGTDNGSDFVSHHMKRVFEGLKIHQDIAPPFTPEHKPFIERAFGTFARDLVELLPRYIGHSVAERKDIEARRSFAARFMRRNERIEIGMSPEDLQEFCDRWTDTIYGIEPHSGLHGRSPFQVTSAWCEPVARIEDERALDILLAPAPGDGWRQVTKKGIRLDHAIFEHPHLGALEGSRVRVLLDESDIGEIYVFDEDEKFICKAVCPERTGISRQELGATRKARQKRQIAEQKAALKASARKMGTKDIVREILIERGEAAGKLAYFPKTGRSHETEALAEAAREAQAARIPQARPLTEAEQRAQERLEAEIAAGPQKSTEVIIFEAKQARLKRGYEIQERICAGVQVDAEDLDWFERFQRMPEFRQARRMAEDFGWEAILAG